MHIDTISNLIELIYIRYVLMPNFAIESFHWEALSLFNLHSDEKKKKFQIFFFYYFILYL